MTRERDKSAISHWLPGLDGTKLGRSSFVINGTVLRTRVRQPCGGAGRCAVNIGQGSGRTSVHLKADCIAILIGVAGQGFIQEGPQGSFT